MTGWNLTLLCGWSGASKGLVVRFDSKPYRGIDSAEVQAKRVVTRLARILSQLPRPPLRLTCAEAAGRGTQSERERIIPVCQIGEKWGIVSDHYTGHQDGSSINILSAVVTRDVMPPSMPSS